MFKKFLSIIPIFSLLIIIFSFWLVPATVPALGVISLLLSLALSTYAIIHKHKETENARQKILKEVGMMVVTLIVVIFLGGIIAMLANYQVGIRWGAIAGIVSAIGASFAVGYLVRKGMMRFAR